MEGSSDDNGLGNSSSVEITGQIMVIAIIVLFVVVVFIMFLHLYAKWFWWRIEQPPEPSPSGRRRGRRRSRFVFAPGQDPAVTLRAGLNPAVLRKIPVVAFNTEQFKDGLECAVCLCELEDGEKARLLPKCNHGFHVECIDMWFQSHSSCPLCRNPVDVNDESAAEIHIQDSQESLESGYSPESSPNNFPTNVLFWGNETQVSSGGACLQEGVSSSSSSSSSTSSGTRMLVIDIPVSNMGGDQLSSLSPEEESKLPPSTRLRSLKRLLSRDKRVSPCSSGSSSSSGTSSSCDVV